MIELQEALQEKKLTEATPRRWRKKTEPTWRWARCQSETCVSSTLLVKPVLKEYMPAHKQLWAQSKTIYLPGARCE